MVDHVLVLNAGYEPMHRVSVPHAIRMLVRQVAVIEEHGEATIGPFMVPKVLRLVRYVVMRWLHNGVPMCTKAGIKARDRHCGYCAGPADTVDHILPRSRGGTRTWENSVAACFKCNNRKANRTPKEAGMKLLVTPHIPKRTAHAF